MKFQDIEIDENIARAVNDMGFTDLTEVQELAIPYLLNHDTDFIGQAQTGTGKTAAFAIPLLHKLDGHRRDIQSLILVPTRELALQVHQEIEKIAKYSGIKSQVIQGGVSYDRQIDGINRKRPQIIVGTPGRIMDLIKRGVLNFENAKHVILDEADEMLNMGFLDAVREIFALVSKEKINWMFSATMPPDIRSLIKKEFNNPYTITVQKKTLSADSIEQKYYLVHESKHLEALCRILDTEPELYGIIFCRTRVDTKSVHEELMARGYAVETLHGDLGQNLRDAAMAKFKRKQVQMMICTDVAARGIDVSNLTHVINYGLPQDTESYVHRIGRTGRAGQKGTAISIIDSRSLGRLRRIEAMIKMPIPQAKLPTVEELKKSRVELELQSMTNIVEMVLEKGDEFKLDETFPIFRDSFAKISKEEILKIMFTFLLNGELRNYQVLGDLNEKPKSKKSAGQKERRVPGGQGGGKKRREETLVSLFLDKGKKDGVHLKQFLREISRQTGIKENNIHNVRLSDQHSFMDVAPHLSNKIMKNKNISLNNKPVRIELRANS